VLFATLYLCKTRFASYISTKSKVQKLTECCAQNIHFITLLHSSGSQGSSVSIVTRLQARPGFNSQQGQWSDFFFFFVKCSDWLWGPPRLPSNRYQKLGGHKADHWPLSSAEVKYAWGYTSIPPIHHDMVHN
jgi:hypothetical protein